MWKLHPIYEFMTNRTEMLLDDYKIINVLWRVKGTIIINLLALPSSLISSLSRLSAMLLKSKRKENVIQMGQSGSPLSGNVKLYFSYFWNTPLSNYEHNMFSVNVWLNYVIHELFKLVFLVICESSFLRIKFSIHFFVMHSVSNYWYYKTLV